MEVLAGMLAAKGVQEISSYVKELCQKKNSDFSSIMEGLINTDAQNNVNEEELFSALVTERIDSLKGADAAAEFQTKLEEQCQALRRADGVVPFEQATENALQAMVDSEAITEEEASVIHAQAFEAAQLDDNHDALYDSRGSEGDITVAMMDLDSALEMARLKIEAFDNGEASADIDGHGIEAKEAHSVVANGTTIDGAGGFLWKPKSDSNGNLVVLLPAEISNNISSVVLKDLEGNVLEAGTFSSLANPDEKGDRAHYRFSKPGGSYGSSVIVEATMNNGEVYTYQINNTSERND